MRLISFALTTDQIRKRSKVVTRRLGWKNLRVGERLQACAKCMGRKPGEPLVKLAVIEVVSVRRERLDALLVAPYGVLECVAEGFPGMDGAGFVRMFCEHMGCTPATEVTRIEFKYIVNPMTVEQAPKRPPVKLFSHCGYHDTPFAIADGCPLCNLHGGPHCKRHTD